MDEGLEWPVEVDEEEIRFRGYEPDSNIVFRLYRKATVWLLTFIIFSILVFQCFDVSTMKCFRNGNCKCDNPLLTTYCWVHGTHTVLRHINRTVGKQVPYPGMGQILEDDTVIDHRAHIWIFPHLILALILFKFPWWLWKKYWEGRRITSFMEALNILLVEDPEQVGVKKDQLLAYFLGQLNSRIHTRMAVRYIVCEIANFLIVLGQMALTDYLLNREFSTYGFDVLSFMVGNQATRVDPATVVFPKLTSCHLHLIGPSGNKQLYEGICVMPLNSLFEICFFLLWFWYMLLASASIIGLIYRMITVYVPPFRYLLLRYQASGCPPTVLKEICKRCTYGDWLLLFTLKNVSDCFFYDEFLEAFGEKLIQEQK